MNVFISGGAKCGKSSLAQDLAAALSSGGKRYYVATMIPTGEEDQERIRRHIADRAGLGFETVECYDHILSVANKDGMFLVDNITSLIQNTLFPAEKNYEMDLDAADRCADELIGFAGVVRHAIFVSDYIYSDIRTLNVIPKASKCTASAWLRLTAVWRPSATRSLKWRPDRSSFIKEICAYENLPSCVCHVPEHVLRHSCATDLGREGEG